MEQFLIILLPQKLHVYKTVENNEFEVFYINGEETLNWSKESYLKDFIDLRSQILDINNYDDLSKVGFDVIYHQVDTHTIKQLSEILLPCPSWQVINFEKILPEILLKMKKIKPNESVNVEFEDTNYLVAMDEKGFIQNHLSHNKGELNIDVKMIPLLLNSSYEFITNEQELKKKDLELTDMSKVNKSLNEKINLLEKEIQIINRKYNETQQELTKKNSLTKKYEVESSKENIIRKRSIVRVVKPNNGSSAFSISVIIGRERRLKVKWMVQNGTVMSANNQIAIMQRLNSEGSVFSSTSIYSEIEGRIFILVNDSEVKEGQAIAVISDPADSMEDIKKWIKEME